MVKNTVMQWLYECCIHCYIYVSDYKIIHYIKRDVMKTILLIEDNADVRLVMEEVLVDAGYKTVIAEGGADGIKKAIEEKPDLIVCDIMMPGMDGYAVIGELHKKPETQGIPFIFMTALADRMDVRKGMDLGADDYITKPLVSGDELVNAIESRLKKNERLKHNVKTGIEGMKDLMQTMRGEDILTQFQDNTRNYKKKQLIYTEDALPVYLYYVKSGKVKLYKTNEDGKELVINISTDGEFIGYNAIIEEDVYKETAEAMEDTELALIPVANFKGMLNNNRDVLQKFVQLLANNVTEREKQLLELAYSSLRKKVANALITLYKKYKKDNVETSSIKIGRENLANITGTAKESVIRTLSDFKDEKLIDIREGSIVILNEEKLSRMMN